MKWNLGRGRPSGRWSPGGSDILWPEAIRVYPGEIAVDDGWARSWVVTGYPREVYPGWLVPLLEFPYPMTVVLWQAPLPNAEAMGRMNRRLTWHKGSAQANRTLGRLEDPAQSTAIEDAERLRQELVRGDTRMLEVGMAITVWAADREELDRVARLFESLAQGILLVVRRQRYQQLEGYLLATPWGSAPAAGQGGREMDTASWATAFPMVSQDLVHSGGQLWGGNESGHAWVVVDRFHYPSPHSLTVGWSGAGKSFSAKLEALRARYHGWAVAVVDPEGEYGGLANAGAQVYRLGAEALADLDPFRIWMGEDIAAYQHQVDFLQRFFGRLAGGVEAQERTALVQALWEALTDGERPVAEAERVRQSRRRFEEALSRLSPAVTARLRPYLALWESAPERIPNQDAAFVVYDLSALTLHLKRALLIALAERLAEQTRSGRRRLVIIDEAWHLLTDSDSAPYLEELFRRARKWNTALSLLTQDIGDFVRNHSAEVCLRNAPLVLLLRQHAESLEQLAGLLRLHPGEIERLGQARRGEGILLAGDDHVPIRIWAAPGEIALIDGTAALKEGGIHAGGT